MTDFRTTTKWLPKTEGEFTEGKDPLYAPKTNDTGRHPLDIVEDHIDNLMKLIEAARKNIRDPAKMNADLAAIKKCASTIAAKVKQL